MNKQFAKGLVALILHPGHSDQFLGNAEIKGFKNRYSMWLTGKYRLEMDIEWKNTENTIGELTLIEISSH